MCHWNWFQITVTVQLVTVVRLEAMGFSKRETRLEDRKWMGTPGMGCRGIENKIRDFNKNFGSIEKYFEILCVEVLVSTSKGLISASLKGIQSTHWQNSDKLWNASQLKRNVFLWDPSFEVHVPPSYLFFQGWTRDGFRFIWTHPLSNPSQFRSRIALSSEATWQIQLHQKASFSYTGMIKMSFGSPNRKQYKSPVKVTMTVSIASVSFFFNSL